MMTLHSLCCGNIGASSSPVVTQCSAFLAVCPWRLMNNHMFSTLSLSNAVRCCQSLCFVLSCPWRLPFIQVILDNNSRVVSPLFGARRTFCIAAHFCLSLCALKLLIEVKLTKLIWLCSVASFSEANNTAPLNVCKCLPRRRQTLGKPNYFSRPGLTSFLIFPR